MRTSMDDADALAGLRLLVAGGDLAAVQVVGARLAALGADATALAGDIDALARAAESGRPSAVLALDGAEAPLRARLDPFGLHHAPLVIGLDALAAADGELGPIAAGRLRAHVESSALKPRQTELEAVVTEQAHDRRRDTEAALQDSLHRLLHAAGYRDDNTYEHTQRVGELAARLARELGLPDREVTLVLHGAPLHDIGKIAVPDSILQKPGPLDDDEWAFMRRHTVIGERIIAVCDSWDAMVSDRSYRHALPGEDARLELVRCSGSQFDPDVVETFLEALGETKAARGGRVAA